MNVKTISRCDLPDTYELDGRIYNVTDYIKFRTKEDHREFFVPVVDIPMTSDYKWQLDCLQDRIDHPEKYAKFENVSETITKIRRWLSDHTPPGRLEI